MIAPFSFINYIIPLAAVKYLEFKNINTYRYNNSYLNMEACKAYELNG